ncbi:MAG TPA: hypothetical protein VNC41_09040 [Acidimicrobiia bacterium]|nr:hypothetical protein [Acidimicrobiia bacterium]
MRSDLDFVELDPLAALAGSFDDLDGPDAIDLGIDTPAADSAARVQWRNHLDQYFRNQGGVDALRLRPSDEAPWPQDDNPMYRYLVERAGELADTEDPAAAMQWLASRAWFEATLAERSRVARLLVDEG